MVNSIEDAPTFVWSLRYPKPNTDHWRIAGIDVSGREELYVDILMNCYRYRHSEKLNTCAVCKERHELPETTDQRYAYRWFPMIPSVKSVIQWVRRNRERKLEYTSLFIHEGLPAQNKVSQ